MQLLNGLTLEEIASRPVDITLKGGPCGEHGMIPQANVIISDGRLFVELKDAFNRPQTLPVPDDAVAYRYEEPEFMGRVKIVVCPGSELGHCITTIYLRNYEDLVAGRSSDRDPLG
ncbi:MAG TPA: hypothetical protein VGG64_17365 [Pirellulales bacterium]|jgi:hypothetical protein